MGLAVVAVSLLRPARTRAARSAMGQRRRVVVALLACPARAHGPLVLRALGSWAALRIRV